MASARATTDSVPGFRRRSDSSRGAGSWHQPRTASAWFHRASRAHPNHLLHPRNAHNYGGWTRRSGPNGRRRQKEREWVDRCFSGVITCGSLGGIGHKRGMPAIPTCAASVCCTARPIGFCDPAGESQLFKRTFGPFLGLFVKCPSGSCRPKCAQPIAGFVLPSASLAGEQDKTWLHPVRTLRSDRFRAD